MNSIKKFISQKFDWGEPQAKLNEKSTEGDQGSNFDGKIF